MPPKKVKKDVDDNVVAEKSVTKAKVTKVAKEPKTVAKKVTKKVVNVEESESECSVEEPVKIVKSKTKKTKEVKKVTNVEDNDENTDEETEQDKNNSVEHNNKEHNNEEHNSVEHNNEEHVLQNANWCNVANEEPSYDVKDDDSDNLYADLQTHPVANTEPNFRNSRNNKNYKDNRNNKDRHKDNIAKSVLNFAYKDYSNVTTSVNDTSTFDLLRVAIVRSHNEGQKPVCFALRQILQACNLEIEFPEYLRRPANSTYGFDRRQSNDHRNNDYRNNDYRNNDYRNNDKSNFGRNYISHNNKHNEDPSEEQTEVHNKTSKPPFRNTKRNISVGYEK